MVAKFLQPMVPDIPPMDPPTPARVGSCSGPINGLGLRRVCIIAFCYAVCAKNYAVCAENGEVVTLPLQGAYANKLFEKKKKNMPEIWP